MYIISKRQTTNVIVTVLFYCLIFITDLTEVSHMQFGDEKFATYLWTHTNKSVEKTKYDANINEIVEKFQMNQPVVVRKGATLLKSQGLVVPNITGDNCFELLIQALPDSQLLNVISKQALVCYITIFNINKYIPFISKK